MVIFLKRIIALILVGMFIFVGCGSSDKPEENYIRKIDGVKYYDAKAAGADKQIILVDPFTGKSAGNHNDYFPEDAEGYYLDDMIFYVDEDVFYRILEKPCAGTGSITTVSAGTETTSALMASLQETTGLTESFLLKNSTTPCISLCANRVNA